MKRQIILAAATLLVPLMAVATTTLDKNSASSAPASTTNLDENILKAVVQEGSIERIDLSRKVIVISGKSYAIDAQHTMVRSIRSNFPVSASLLQPGQSVAFTVNTKGYGDGLVTSIFINR